MDGRIDGGFVGQIRTGPEKKRKMRGKECDLHDILYDIGGNYIDRKIADLKLLNDMLKNVNKYYYKRKILSKVWFLFLCRLYYIGVRIFGFTQFNYER